MVDISQGTAHTTQAEQRHRRPGAYLPPFSVWIYKSLHSAGDREHWGWTQGAMGTLCWGNEKRHAQIAKDSGRTLSLQYRQDQAGGGELSPVDPPAVPGMSSSPPSSSLPLCSCFSGVLYYHNVDDLHLSLSFLKKRLNSWNPNETIAL